MKYFICSDIHGSAFYCEKMIEAFEREKADKLVILGDVLYHGPRNDLPGEYAPKKVIEMLNSKKDVIMCVRGNCDAEVDQMVLDFPILADYCLISYNNRTIFATHGHIFNTSHLPPVTPGDILVHGHTHVPACEKRGDITYLNPGSVSIPKLGSTHGYMTFEDGKFIWRDLDGNELNSYNM